MSFPNRPTPLIKAWDRYAGEAACIAQLFYAADILPRPFDAEAFDRIIRRHPKQFLYNAEWLRIICRRLPSVEVWRIGPEGMDEVISPDEVKKMYVRAGKPEIAATHHVKSPRYQQSAARAADIERAAQELGGRHHRVVGDEIAWQAKAMLDRGAMLIVDSQIDLLDTPLLIAPNNSVRVSLFRPRTGIEQIRLSVINRQIVNFNLSGFTAYTMH